MVRAWAPGSPLQNPVSGGRHAATGSGLEWGAGRGVSSAAGVRQDRVLKYFEAREKRGLAGKAESFHAKGSKLRCTDPGTKNIFKRL